MHKTLLFLGAMLSGALLTTACSHPLPKLAYADGSKRIPINPPQAIAPKASDARDSSASPATGASAASGSPSGERP